jgi:hypothetical protein
MPGAMRPTVRGPIRITMMKADEEHVFVRESTSSREGSMLVPAESGNSALPKIQTAGVAVGVESCSETGVPVPSFDFLG